MDRQGAANDHVGHNQPQRQADSSVYLEVYSGARLARPGATRLPNDRSRFVGCFTIIVEQGLSPHLRREMQADHRNENGFTGKIKAVSANAVEFRDAFTRFNNGTQSNEPVKHFIAGDLIAIGNQWKLLRENMLTTSNYILLGKLSPNRESEQAFNALDSAMALANISARANGGPPTTAP